MRVGGRSRWKRGRGGVVLLSMRGGGGLRSLLGRFRRRLPQGRGSQAQLIMTGSDSGTRASDSG